MDPVGRDTWLVQLRSGRLVETDAGGALALVREGLGTLVDTGRERTVTGPAEARA